MFRRPQRCFQVALSCSSTDISGAVAIAGIGVGAGVNVAAVVGVCVDVGVSVGVGGGVIDPVVTGAGFSGWCASTRFGVGR
jgi:hypothetical protein